MKKLLVLTFIFVAFMTSCSKDDEPTSGFSDAEKAALQVLNGTFFCEGTTIVFSPFLAPTPKKSTANDVPINFCGTLSYDSKYYDNEFYFYINTTKKQIVANSKHSEKQDYFNALVGKIWDYEIIDKNTIKLFDTDLSNPLVQTKTFTRR